MKMTFMCPELLPSWGWDNLHMSGSFPALIFTPFPLSPGVSETGIVRLPRRFPLSPLLQVKILLSVPRFRSQDARQRAPFFSPFYLFSLAPFQNRLTILSGAISPFAGCSCLHVEH